MSGRIPSPSCPPSAERAMPTMPTTGQVLSSNILFRTFAPLARFWGFGTKGKKIFPAPRLPAGGKLLRAGDFPSVRRLFYGRFRADATDSAPEVVWLAVFLYICLPTGCSPESIDPPGGIRPAAVAPVSSAGPAQLHGKQQFHPYAIHPSFPCGRRLSVVPGPCCGTVAPRGRFVGRRGLPAAVLHGGVLRTPRHGAHGL